MLAGALPANDPALLQELVAGVEQAIAGLPPAARKELDQLFALLSFAPSRALVGGVWSPWHEATSGIDRRLSRPLARQPRRACCARPTTRCISSSFAAWYGNPNAWPAIGYPGPPSLEVG